METDDVGIKNLSINDIAECAYKCHTCSDDWDPSQHHHRVELESKALVDQEIANVVNTLNRMNCYIYEDASCQGCPQHATWILFEFHSANRLQKETSRRLKDFNFFLRRNADWHVCSGDEDNDMAIALSFPYKNIAQVEK